MWEPLKNNNGYYIQKQYPFRIKNSNGDVLSDNEIGKELKMIYTPKLVFPADRLTLACIQWKNTPRDNWCYIKWVKDDGEKSIDNLTWDYQHNYIRLKKHNRYSIFEITNEFTPVMPIKNNKSGLNVVVYKVRDVSDDHNYCWVVKLDDKYYRLSDIINDVKKNNGCIDDATDMTDPSELFRLVDFIDGNRLNCRVDNLRWCCFTDELDEGRRKIVDEYKKSVNGKKFREGRIECWLCDNYQTEEPDAEGTLIHISEY